MAQSHNTFVQYITNKNIPVITSKISNKNISYENNWVLFFVFVLKGGNYQLFVMATSVQYKPEFLNRWVADHWWALEVFDWATKLFLFSFKL